MRRSSNTASTNALALICLAIFFILVFTACSRKVYFASSSVVPAAEGSVKMKKDHNGNHVIEVTVKNLVEARKLQTPGSIYMVWIDTETYGTKNLGQLKSSSGLFSSTLKASLKAVSAFKPVRVYITLERNNDAMYPGQTIVLTTGYLRT